MNFIPLHDKVLVLRRKPDEQIGLIHIAPTAQEKPLEGTVIACGEGKVLPDGTLRPLAVAVGQTVLWGKYAGSEVTIDEVEYLLLREDEILGRIEE